MSATATTRQGILLGIGAYGSWGLIPLYFKAVKHVAPLELLAHRAAWSFLVLALLVRVLRRGADLKQGIRTPRVRRLLILSTFCIAANWLLFIYSVVSNQVLQASLGYFINPLLNVLLGVLVFHERLRPLQIVSIGLATLGVALYTSEVAHFPWLALSLAATFSLYGMLRKLLPIDGLVSLTAETSALAPLALIYLAWLFTCGQLTGRDPSSLGLLMLGGLVTTVPLLLFGGAARRLKLSTMGILQYLSPTLQFLLAVAVFHEPLSWIKLLSFAGIWIAIAIYAADSFRAHRTAVLEIIEPD